MLIRDEIAATGRIPVCASCGVPLPENANSMQTMCYTHSADADDTHYAIVQNAALRADPVGPQVHPGRRYSDEKVL